MIFYIYLDSFMNRVREKIGKLQLERFFCYKFGFFFESLKFNPLFADKWNIVFRQKRAKRRKTK